MKPIYAHLSAAIALSFAAAACIPPAPSPSPPVQTRPAPIATPAPAPAPAPVSTNWLDRPASDGDWYYRSEGNRTLALFGGEETEADFILRCARGSGVVEFAHAGEATSPLAMRVRTETAERVLTARPDGGALPYIVAAVPARDPLLDAMALSKGRFAIEVAGAEPLYLPAWAEVTRVIEDCR